MSVPTFGIRCVDVPAAEKLAADLTENKWDNVRVAGCVVSFPATNPAGVIALAEHALEAGLADDAECARLIGSLG